MNYTFDGKVAIVTGGHSGIGAGIAESLAARNAYVFLAARRITELEREAAKINSGGKTLAYPFEVDLTETDGSGKLVAYTMRTKNRVDIIINAAGVHPLDSDPAEKIGAAYKLNVTAKRNLNSSCIDRMLIQGGGRIINVSSMAAEREFPNQGNYHKQMKEIVEHSSKLDKKYGSQGIVVRAIGPGLVNTPLARRDFRDLAIERVGKDLDGTELENGIDAFWNTQVLQPAEIAEWVCDIIQNPEKYKCFETKVKAVL